MAATLSTTASSEMQKFASSEFLQKKRIVIQPGKTPLLDGAMGTELVNVGATKMGKPGWTMVPHLSAEGQAKIMQVHRSYLEAGCDIICTHTYNMSELYFKSTGLDTGDNDVAEMQRRAVHFARQAVSEFKKNVFDGGGARPLVAAVSGPYAASAIPGGDYDTDYSTIDPEVLRAFHRKRVSALASAGPDILIFETLTSLSELRAIVDVLEELSLTGWACFACHNDGNGKTSNGESWTDILELAERSPCIEAVGVNCTMPLGAKVAIEMAQRLTTKPLVCYPNNGVWCKKETRWVDGTPDDFVCTMSPYMSSLCAVGGCCCTGPVEMQALGKAMKMRPKSSL